LSSWGLFVFQVLLEFGLAFLEFGLDHTLERRIIVYVGVGKRTCANLFQRSRIPSLALNRTTPTLEDDVTLLYIHARLLCTPQSR
jgi:hypothetical protein